MGVDWIPFRIDRGVDPAIVATLADAEWRRFVARRGWVDLAWRRSVMPRVEGLRDACRLYRRHGPLADKLLFKGVHGATSHRVYVVTDNPLLPPAMRLAAYRTIVPDALPTTVAAWRRRLAEVRAGRHHDELAPSYEWWACAEAARFDDNSRWTARAVAGAEGWVTPEVRAIALELERLPRIATPPTAAWRDVFERRRGLADRWDAAVRSRKRHLRARPPDTFDEWLAGRLADDWFARFSEWVEPWAAGGYGLYRDCE